MKKFKYKYERLLNIREIEEKREMAILVKMRYETEAKKQQENEKNGEIAGLNQTIEKLDRFTIEDMKYYSFKMHALDRELKQIKKEYEKLIANEKKQEEKVLQISKNRKILEKLKEKHKILFNKEQEKLSNKFLDELGTQRFLRKKGLL